MLLDKFTLEDVHLTMVENFNRLGMPFKLDAEPEGETIYKNTSYVPPAEINVKRVK